jgi:hypothetical protein
MLQFKEEILNSIYNLRVGGPHGNCSNRLHDCPMDNEKPEEKLQKQSVVFDTRNAQLL